MLHKDRNITNKMLSLIFNPFHSAAVVLYMQNSWLVDLELKPTYAKMLIQ